MADDNLICSFCSKSRKDTKKMIVGAVVFGPGGESHAGYCHGGTMTAVLDDVLGHCAFICGGGNTGNWGGATVKVNCSLKRPIKVGSILKVWGRVREKQGRKIFIDGAIEAEDGSVHATLDGMAVECTRAQLFGE